MKIAIASGKGGTGKTTLAVNLACLLAERQEIVLTDLDVEEPNSGLFISGRLECQEDKFKMIPDWQQGDCILCGNCQKVCNFHAVIKLADQIMIFPELCHSCYACSELCPTKALPMIPRKMGELKHFSLGKIDFIESKLDIGQEQAVPLIAQTLDYVEEHFPPEVLKIYDSPPGTSCPVIEATKEADFVILVTEPTPFGLHDLKLAVETMQELKKDFAIVINRFGIGDDKVIDYCISAGIKILAKLPNERKIAELYSKGKIIYPHFPAFKAELFKIAEYILLLQKEGSI